MSLKHTIVLRIGRVFQTKILYHKDRNIQDKGTSGGLSPLSIVHVHGHISNRHLLYNLIVNQKNKSTL